MRWANNYLDYLCTAFQQKIVPKVKEMKIWFSILKGIPTDRCSPVDKYTRTSTLKGVSLVQRVV